jgi:Holliday junction resolvase RusA-like endonuclease
MNDRQAWTDFVERTEQAKIPARVTSISFTVDGKPAPQGSMKGVAITRADGSPGTIFKSDNPRTHPYREQVAWEALRARAAAGIHQLFAPITVPVAVSMTFVFKKPKSCPASRTRPVVKPDYDKLARSTTDALTGILYADDCQVVDGEQHKIYGDVEQVHICVRLVEEN